MKWRNRHWTFFLLPGLAGTFLFYLLPFGEVFRRSFIQSGSGKFTGFENYADVLRNGAFQTALRNTLIFLGAGVPLVMILSLFAALLLRKALGSGKLLSVLLLPMAVPAAVMVLILRIFTDKNGFINGTVNCFSHIFAFLPENLHLDYMNSGWGILVIVAAFVWKNCGYMAVLWLAGLATLPEETEEAAAVDGAGDWQKFFHIILPELKGSFYTVLILAVLQAFKSYREIWMAAGSYPAECIYLLQHLMQNWYLKLEFDKLAALTVMAASVIFVFCILLQRRMDLE